MLTAKVSFKSGYRKGLYFGLMVEAEALTAESYEQHKALPDRKDCLVCGRPLRGNNDTNYNYPCCSRDCKGKYREWLNE